jgi:hypothetical protein
VNCINFEIFGQKVLQILVGSFLVKKIVKGFFLSPTLTVPLQIVHAPYFKNDEVYYLIEPDKIHCSYYWVKQLFEDDFVAIVFGLWRELNSVGLTRVESFLLIAVAVFNEGQSILLYLLLA